MIIRMFKHLLFTIFISIAASVPAAASTSDTDVQTAWRLLDYVGVDYS